MRNKYEISGDTTIVFVSYKDKEMEVLVDTDDLEMLKAKKVTWCITEGGRDKKMYVKCWDGTKLHRFLTGAKRGQIVDHRDGNTLNNKRKSNLRIGTQSLNMQNQSRLRSDNTSGLRGVYWRKDKGKWCAEIRVNGKKKHIGYFLDKEEAHQAVLEARQKYMKFSEG